MRHIVADQTEGDAAADSVAVAWDVNVDLDALLQPFRQQSFPVRSVVTAGIPLSGDTDPTQLRLAFREHGVSVISGHRLGASDLRCDDTLKALARDAEVLCGAAPGHDLLLTTQDLLSAMLPYACSEIGFRAVALLSSQVEFGAPDAEAWRLQRKLFDDGLVAVGLARFQGASASCFLASDAVASFDRLGAATRGSVTMTTLGQNGRFANQLFQYAFVKLYALRHGLSLSLPDWQGRRLFGLDDNFCSADALPRVSFNGFTDQDRLLWEADDPPIDIDVWGYFQEVPHCWRRHRSFLQHMFQLPVEHRNAVAAWREDVTRGDERTLVAVHVRRGDYRELNLPWFRLVPEDYYIDWLRAIWPTLRDPLLFVAADEPDVIVPRFQEFAPIAKSAALDGLPGHVSDFEILRQAHYLAICNSSFSRMAAILASPSQLCFIPSFETKGFDAYEPWIDRGFWARFAERPDATSSKRQAISEKHEDRIQGAESTIYFDVSDLLLYIADHPTLSGIQRVQCEIIRQLIEHPQADPVRFVTLRDGYGLAAIQSPALLSSIDLFSSGAVSQEQIRASVHDLINRSLPCALRAGDVFLTVGAFWAVRGIGRLLQQLKNTGVIVGLFIHDIIPITHPEYFRARDVKVFVKAMVEALTFADFILTSSGYNKAAIDSHCTSRGFAPRPIHVVPLAHELACLSTSASKISDEVAEIADREFVLCVGTIEVRKNPAYLFNIWKLMTQSDRREIPTLVFAGRTGWLVRDFIEQLEICGYLAGKITILTNVNDVELDLLYRRCLLTMFPSFAEGWGLPVGEALAHGKVSICAAEGGVPEVGKALADYVDPYNVRSGLEQLLRYLDNCELRRRREEQIADQFKPRSWRQVAEELTSFIRSMASETPELKLAAITLPANKFIPIGSNAAVIPLNGEDGSLSAEVACITGWRAPQGWGVWADQFEATLRFRATCSPGSKIHLILRLAGLEGANYRLRVSSAPGAETIVSLDGEVDKVATLCCEVGCDGLVTASLTLLNTAEALNRDGPYWCLKGLLYLEPQGIAAALPQIQGRKARSPEPAEPPREATYFSRIKLSPVEAKDEIGSVETRAKFLESRDCFWIAPPVVTHHEPPIFADSADEAIFFSRYRNAERPPLGEVEKSMTVLRRGEQYVSMSRRSEGAVFDCSGVRRGFGFLEGAPLSHTPWLLRDVSGVSVTKNSLTKPPFHEKSFFIFYNGNLHNYYHWLAEALLPLDALSSVMSKHDKLHVALPKSIDIAALFDHRATLRALGFDHIEITEVGDNLIKVAEAIWVGSDLIEQMPATYLKSFQRRIASRYPGSSGPRNRRLLIERKGPTRRIQNFDEVQSLLAQEGFETVFLERMAIEDQISLFRDAEFVIGAHGAGLTNLLFCEPGTKVLEFMPSVEMRPFFWLISEGLELRHAVQFCRGVDGDSFQATLNVDIAKLKALYRIVDGGCRSVT